MSKIIVDQFAKNGGSTFTLPATIGSLNSPLVTDANGVLSFATNKMPATDGTANQVLLTNGSAQLGWSVNKMPATDGTANQVLVTNGSAQLGWSVNKMPAADGAANAIMVTNGSSQLGWHPTKLPSTDGTVGQFLATNGSGQFSWTSPSGALPNDNNLLVGSIASTQSHGNTGGVTSTSSSGPYTTYYHYNFGSPGDNSTIQGWNLFLGDGYPEGTSNIWKGSMGSDGFHRYVDWAAGNRTGNISRLIHYQNNNTSYTGRTWRCLPVRNTSSSAQTVTVYFGYSNYWSSGYEGYTVSTWEPNATTYSATSGGTWTRQSYSSSGGQGTNTTGSVNISFAANRTTLLMLASTHYYYTTYQFYDTNYFYNIAMGNNGLWSNSNLICDLRILYTLAMAKGTNNLVSSANPQDIYTAAASIWGNR
jgi:hypothetical protein